MMINSAHRSVPEVLPAPEQQLVQEDLPRHAQVLEGPDHPDPKKRSKVKTSRVRNTVKSTSVPLIVSEAMGDFPQVPDVLRGGN